MNYVMNTLSFGLASLCGSILALLVLEASTARAGVITGVTVTTNMGNQFTSNITHITNGNGLSSYDPTATHAFVVS